ncbi:hypothetical protein [Vibrio parahaemolyticus]|uniref:hypothetical protein n=1 Tax=Vibrio parahaemolyticus TaxID=670 RepID=UPI00111038E5|nr:hypothetical protein [Vibrio parahaemolyticus]TMX39464.1 hypothetical protein DA098_09245 [Vibrio parahaemolyticus]TMX80470.1 hypothetical protein DA094_02735 [Vibrio parahaemolyticus]
MKLVNYTLEIIDDLAELMQSAASLKVYWLNLVYSTIVLLVTPVMLGWMSPTNEFEKIIAFVSLALVAAYMTVNNLTTRFNLITTVVFLVVIGTNI